MNDLKFAIRQLLRNPGFTVVAVLTLALGIGANTAIFSLVNEVLLRSLPVRKPGELVLFRTIEGKGGHMSHAGEDNGFVDPASGRWSSTSFSLLIFERFCAYHSALSNVFAYAPFSGFHLLIDGQPDASIQGQFVSGNYYLSLGVPAILGRTLAPEDDRSSAEPVAVISYRYWQNRFGGDRGVIGKVIQINRVGTTIIGVTSLGFSGAMQVGESADITVPLAHHARFQPDSGHNRAQSWYWWIRIMGRLAPHSTAAQARASLQATFQQTAREGWLTGLPFDVESGGKMPEAPALATEPGGRGENDKRREYARPLRVLTGLVSLVLAAACGNVANLLLARGATRRREIGLRFALGASRSRVVLQLLVESSLLAFVGALLGVLLAFLSRGVLIALRPWAGSLAVLELPIDERVLAFTIIIAAASALLFGLAPALRATRFNLSAEFQGGMRQLGAGERSRLSQGLMVVQVALSLVLLISTGLFVRTLRNLQNVDPGFNQQNLVLFHIDATSAGYTSDQLLRFQARLRERLENIPGVGAATFSHVALLDGDRENRNISVTGHASLPGESMVFDYNGVAPNFFDALEIPLVEGRKFEDRDNAKAPRVAIINQSFARKVFGDQNPVGRRFGFNPANPNEVEIISVARDAKYGWLRAAAPATVYVPAVQDLHGAINYCVRAVGDSGAVIPAIRAAVREVDPTLPVMNLRTQGEQLARINWQEVLLARLSGFFGVVALALSCVGLYGLISYQVLRRTGEIGVRMALGAQRSNIVRMVLGQGMKLAGVGIIVGLVGAFTATQLLRGLLFGVSPVDPTTFLTVPLLLVLVALVAAWLPAKRATHIDPMEALRSER